MSEDLTNKPEADDTECDNTYHEGSCECCDRFEECLQEWREDEE